MNPEYFLPPKLDFRMPPKRIWEVLSSSVKKDRQALFNLGCMLRQIIAEKAFAHLHCEDFVGLCRKLEISERRGRRLIHFSLLTLDAQRILSHELPTPLSNVEFAERLYLAKEKLCGERYGELLRDYYAQGRASDELEERLAKLTGKGADSVTNLSRLNTSRAKAFLGFLTKEPWEGALVDFDAPQILSLSLAKKREVLKALQLLEKRLAAN